MLQTANMGFSETQHKPTTSIVMGIDCHWRTPHDDVTSV